MSRPPSPMYQRVSDLPDHIGDAALTRYLRQRWPDGTLRVLDVEGFDVPLLFAGDKGPPVLFVHGLGHDLSDWAPLFARRRQGRFAALDLPGFGCATLPEAGARLADLTLAIAAAVDACGEAPILVGSSLGGHVAQLAVLMGVPCAGLFLLAPGGYQDKSALAATSARALFSAARLLQRTEAELQLVNDAIYTTAAARDDALTRRVAMFRSARAALYARSMATVVDDVFKHLVHERALSLNVPVTFVFGEHDRIVPRAPVEAIAERMGTPVHVIGGCGHVPMIDAPDETMTLLDAFVAQCAAIDVRAPSEGVHNVGR